MESTPSGGQATPPQPGDAPQGYAPAGYAPPGYAPQGYAPQGYAPAGAYPYPPNASEPRRGTSGWVIALVLAVVLLPILGCGLFAAIGALSEDGGLSGEAIAVIHLEGAISGGRGGVGAATPERIISQLRQADADDSVKAILLRIESPGGTVAASEEIAMEVARMKKPVVASIGDLGASGAYMVAAECDEIVAAPSSSVGSIGVIATIPNVKELLDKVGIDFTVIHEGKYKDAGSPYRAMTPAEKKLFEADIKQIYERFIKRVAKARKMPEGKVRELATGWVWSGVEAKELGLVDTIGNYSDGVKAAGRRGGIEGTPETVSYDDAAIDDLLREVIGISSKFPGIGVRELAGPAVPEAR